jgi:polysaccharide biosynthesis transport protein
MKKARLKNLNDYMALIVRRKWWVIIPTIALCGMTLLLAKVFPKMYTSRTMILIQQRDVPSDFVKDLIGGNTDERLSAIEQTILSRTNLLKILGENEAQLPEYRALNDERKVEKLQKRIAIEFPSEKRRGVFLPTTSIQIAYRDQNPALAQKIAGSLAALFIEQDNRARETKVFGTADFFKSELEKVAGQLKESEDKLRKLKQENRYSLPTEQETNLRTLDRLQIQKNGNLEALDRYVTLQMNLERQISETPALISRESAAARSGSFAPAPNPKVELYRKKEQEYNDLTARAKPTHPDVRRVKAELEKLKQEIPPEDFAAAEQKGNPAQPAPDMVPNPVYQSLTGQLRQLKTDIAIREKEKKWIEDEIGKYNLRIQNTPRVEQDMLGITRANQELTKQHEDLKTKLEQANLASSLESKQKGAQFTIIDAANYPLEPSPPGKPVIVLVGFGLSIAAGVGIAVVTSSLNQRVWTHQEVERAFEAPVLVEIPSIVTPADLKTARLRKIAQAAALVLLAGLYLGGLYYLYARQSTVLRVLDPLIEKIQERAAN